MLKHLSVELDNLTNKIQTLPVTKLYKFDGILSDLANHICEIDEYISEGEKNQSELLSNDRKVLLTDIMALEKQLLSLSDLLYKIGYDSHYMDRTLSILGSALEGIKEFKIELK